jgi:hypothetical protein
VPLPVPRPPATVPPGTPQAAVVPVPAAPSAVLTEVDISDPAAPRIVHTLEVPGSVLSARLTGAVARVALQTLPSGGNPARAATWLPRGVLRRPHARRARARALVHCRAVRRAAGFPGTDVLTVLTIDLDRGLPAVDSDAVMTAGETVYGSPDNFYVAAARYTRAPATVIHRFAAAAGDSTAYAGSAEVAGSLLSQWSLSEHAGFLRVATTDGDAGGLVSVLDVARMAPVGRLAGLGPGERLQGVRFVGDIGFVVTFRQIDPLHVVDLSDPAHPALRGELQIPGYSAYLHPLGPGRLLGVGQDATPEGRLLGAQLSLFDVSDLAHPTRIAHRSLGEGTSTEVEWDHHAFFYDAGQQLVVLPVDNVADAFRLGAASIDPAGSIEHHGAAVRRTLLIGGRLYTVSDAGVMASALPTLAELGFARF